MGRESRVCKSRTIKGTEKSHYVTADDLKVIASLEQRAEAIGLTLAGGIEIPSEPLISLTDRIE